MNKANKPVRVLMVNYKMQCAGIEAFIMNMYRNIDRTKVQFDFLVHYQVHQFFDDEIESMGGRIYRLSVREDNNIIKYLRDLKAFFAEHPEYKIVHGHMESFGVIYLKAAKDAGINVRIAHSHIAQKNKGVKGTVKGMMNSMFKKYATHLLACSDDAGKFVFGNNAKYAVFNNAIDLKKYIFNPTIRNEARHELNIDESQFVIGHVGRFNTQKNHLFLINVFKCILDRHCKSVLLLIGEGDLEEDIKKEVSLLGLESSVKFLNVRKDVNRLYQAMDIFMLPSLFEGLPVSGIEAQASGLRCVFSDTVTEQVDVTKNIKFLSLNNTYENWAEEALKFGKTYERENVSQKIQSAGYEIGDRAKKLEEFYLSFYSEGLNGL